MSDSNEPDRTYVHTKQQQVTVLVINARKNYEKILMVVLKPIEYSRFKKILGRNLCINDLFYN